MMTALAIVTAIQPTVKDHDTTYIVTLSCKQQTSCNHCQSSSHCGTGVVSKALGNKTLHWTIRSDHAVQVGQQVEIGIPEKGIIQSAALVYFIPLFMMMLGAWLGHSFFSPQLSDTEGMTIALSFLFILFGIVLARKLSKAVELRTRHNVILLRVLDKPISNL